jgi:dienelactone hydrolase
MKRPAQIALAALCCLAAPATATAGGGDAVRARAALRSARFFTEVFAPRAPARGVVLTLHQSGWQATGRAAAAREHPEDRFWLRRRWIAVNSSYRPGRAGLRDVLWVYDSLRRSLGPDEPICLSGASAGGNLALLAAARRRSVACVVARAAPSDLVHIGGEAAYDRSARGPVWVHDQAQRMLGAGALGRFSPMRVARRIRALVLLAEAAHDALIPWRQQLDLKRELRDRCVGVVRLAPGDARFVHARVSRPSSRDFTGA